MAHNDAHDTLEAWLSAVTLFQSSLASYWCSLLVPALAHSEAIAGGFLSGLAHPISGWDHVVAMVAVGLWGAFLGLPAIWLLPIVFPMVMALGGSLGILGIAVPFVEVHLCPHDDRGKHCAIGHRSEVGGG